MIRRKLNESKNKNFDNFLYYLLEELNHVFNQKGFWHLTDEGDYYVAVIEHDNGSKVELYDEVLTGDEVITMVVVYPNGRSRWIAQFKKEDDLIDMADKIYEYVVVKNPTKHEGVNPMIRRKINEDNNFKAHRDWAIGDVKQDLENLLKLHQSIKPYHFNEKYIRDSISRIENLLAHLYSAYRIESMVGTGVSDDKNLYGEAEDEMLRAKIEAEKLVRILDGFNHKFYL